jgi:hypothetical protein
LLKDSKFSKNGRYHLHQLRPALGDLGVFDYNTQYEKKAITIFSEKLWYAASNNIAN